MRDAVCGRGKPWTVARVMEGRAGEINHTDASGKMRCSTGPSGGVLLLVLL